MTKYASTIMALALVIMTALAAGGDATYQALTYSNDWSNTGLITTNDDWSGVPGVIGYRGDNLTAVTGTDPQTLLADDTAPVVDVNANQTNPDGFFTGGVTEFELADPVVALTGSGTADAPYIVFHVDATGQTNIPVSYRVRDLEAGADDAQQQVALHFRVGSSGSWTNVPAAYIADATIPNATTEQTVSVTLPAAADNAAQLQIRVMTTNAPGNDEWVGIDNVQIGPPPPAPGVSPIGIALMALLLGGTAVVATRRLRGVRVA